MSLKFKIKNLHDPLIHDPPNTEVLQFLYLLDVEPSVSYVRTSNVQYILYIMIIDIRNLPYRNYEMSFSYIDISPRS